MVACAVFGLQSAGVFAFYVQGGPATDCPPPSRALLKQLKDKDSEYVTLAIPIVQRLANYVQLPFKIDTADAEQEDDTNRCAFGPSGLRLLWSAVVDHNRGTRSPEGGRGRERPRGASQRLWQALWQKVQHWGPAQKAAVPLEGLLCRHLSARCKRDAHTTRRATRVGQGRARQISYLKAHAQHEHITGPAKNTTHIWT